MDYSYTPYTSGVPSSSGPTKTRLLLYIMGGTVAILTIIVLVMLFTRGDEKPADSAAEQPLTVELVDATSEPKQITGATKIELKISEPARVARVEYSVDKTFAAVTYAAPFSFTFEPAKYGNGGHEISAIVFDKKGKSYNTRVAKVIVELPPDALVATPPTPVAPAQGSSTRPRTGRTTTPPDTSPVTPPTPPDTVAPSTPSGLAIASSPGGYTTTLTWTASTDNVGVARYQIYRDGQVLGTSTTASYQDQTVVPGNTYSYSLAALDAADNMSDMSGQPSVTLEPTSIWIDADTPYTFANDGTPLELGVKFVPLVDGKVSGVRFYKPPSDNSTHTGRLWEADGTPITSVVFSNESASGWQEAIFATPVDVTANTTYVVSYTSTSGHYSSTTLYFMTQGITSQYLRAPNNVGAGGNGNGVFANGGQFPTGSYQGTNYWVDALFVPNPDAGGPAVTNRDNSKVYPGYAGSNNTGVPSGTRLPQRDRDLVITTDNTVVEHIHISAQVDVRAENVLFRNMKVFGLTIIDLDMPNSEDWSLVVENATLDASNTDRAPISQGHYTLRNVNVVGGRNTAYCSGECVVENSWFHGQYLPANESSGLAAFTSNGGSNIAISNSTIACDTPDNGVGGGCAAGLVLTGDFAAIESVTVTNNLFTANTGMEYCASLAYTNSKPFGAQTKNIVMINNVFQKGPTGKCGYSGPAYQYMYNGSPAPGNVWSNNRYDDGSVVPAPTL